MFPFVKRIQQGGSKHHRLDEKLTLNQFFEEHYFHTPKPANDSHIMTGACTTRTYDDSLDTIC